MYVQCVCKSNVHCKQNIKPTNIQCIILYVRENHLFPTVCFVIELKASHVVNILTLGGCIYFQSGP